MSDQVKIQFLGTGASVPSKYRGFSSLILNYDEKLILFDCGEGTQMRLQQAGIKPFRISTILISHLHGDHLFGLPGLLASMQMGERQTPLDIYGPVGLQAFLQALQQTIHFQLDYPISIHELSAAGQNFSVGVWDVAALPLEHKIPCFGYRLQEPEKSGELDAAKAEMLGVPHGPERAALKRGEKILVHGREIHPHELVGETIPGRIFAYCTDTLPCENAVKLADHADLLVHDSTFTDEFTEQAMQTKHSTARQAAEVARASQAKQLALYHISIRFHGRQENDMLQQAQSVFTNTVLPQDFAEIDLRRGA